MRSNVSIRFHRGGPSHPPFGFGIGGVLVSIRFHRGGPSHEVFPSFRYCWSEFQSAFIAVARLTSGPELVHGADEVSIRFHRGGPSHG